MDSIMTYITQCDQILYGILATILMLLFMMKLQHFSRVIPVELIPTPSTTGAFKTVSFQYSHSNRIWNNSIMFICLVIFFKYIYTNIWRKRTRNICTTSPRANP